MFNNLKILISTSFIATSTPTPSNIYVAPVVDDFERFTATTVGNQLSSDRNFTGADVGKIVVLKNARNYSAYRTAPVTYTGVIDSVALGVATISSPLSHTLIDVTNEEIYIGTNNFDIVQTAIDYCYANGYDVLHFDFSGTALIHPELSTIAPTQGHTSDHFRGLQLSGDLTVMGNGKDITILKWASEDIMNHVSTEYEYAGFNFKSGEFVLQDFNIEAPDRLTTRTSSNVAAVRSVLLANDHRSITLDNINIDGDRHLGWYAGFYSSRGGDNAYRCKYNFIDTKITAKCNMTIFSQDGAYIDYYVRNLEMVGGGSKEYRDPYIGGTDINIGTNTLTVTNDDFSWYDFNSYVSALPKFKIDGSFLAEVSGIINKNIATINLNADATYSGADIFVYGRGTGTEGHTQYIHPNVSLDIDGMTISQCGKLSMHQHSGGGVPGYTSLMNLKNITIDGSPLDAYVADAGGGSGAPWEMDYYNFNGTYFVLEDNNFKLYSNFDIPVNMTNCNIVGGQFGGGIVTSSTGILDTRSYANVTFNDIQGSYIYTRDLGSSKTTTINNSGETIRVSGITWYSGSLVLNNVDTSELGIAEAVKTGVTLNLTNVDIRICPNFPIAFTGSWSTPEKEDFMTRCTFSGCTCSASAYAAMPVEFQPHFTIT